jgi:nitrate reductase NapD
MRLNRRQVLGGSAANCCHIASMVVQCRPEKLEATASAIAAIANAEIPERDERGKLVVLIEAEGEAALMSCISKIESTPGVISANLVYHQIDDVMR